MAHGLIEQRRKLEALAAGIGASGATIEDEAEAPPDPLMDLCSAIECLLCDHFDPLLRGLLGAMSEPPGQLVAVVQELWGVERRLQRLATELPRSPREEAMLEGEIEPDEPTEVRTVISTVLGDQLHLAVENLLYAALYKPPESAGEPREPAR